MRNSANTWRHNPRLIEQVRMYLKKWDGSLPSLKGWLREVHISRPTFEKIRGWIAYDDKLRSLQHPNVREIQELMYADVHPMSDEQREEFAYEEHRRQIEQLDKSVQSDALLRSGAPMKELAYARLEIKTGEKLLPDKQPVAQVNIGISIAEEHRLAIEQAEQELAKEGMVQVPTKPAILLPEVCKDSGQGEDGNDSVRAVASSDSAP